MKGGALAGNLTALKLGHTALYFALVRLDSANTNGRGAMATATATKWALRGRGYEFCNCDFGCGCNFGGFPNSEDGSCRALVGMVIDSGSCGSVDLSGLKCAG